MGQLYALDFPNGKRYIGITTKTAEVRFKGHERDAPREKPGGGPALYRAWRKHGAPALTVLAIVEDEDLLETEKRAVAVFGTLSPGGYNLTEGGDANPSKRPEVRAKMSAAATGRKQSLEMIAKRAAANRGKKRSAEAIAKTAAAHRGKTVSDATRAKIGAANRGKTVSDAARAKLSAALRGKKKSPEHAAKVAAAQRGRKMSPEAIAKIAAAKRGRKQSPETIAKRVASRKANALV